MPENNLPVGAGTTLSGPAIDARVGNEVKDFGMALGDLVKHVGKAVAEAQKQLNQTSAETASKLAETTVKVVAVRERFYDDDGNPMASDADENEDKVGIHHMELPMVNFLDPVFYRWNRVRLQGQFQATEWKGSTSTDTDVTRYGGSVSLFVGAPVNDHASQLLGMAGKIGDLAKGAVGDLGGLGGNARASLYYNDSNTHLGTSSASDVSYGQMRMNAELTPVEGIGVPKPTQVFITPRIGVSPVGAVADAAEVRSMEILVEYVRPVTKKDRADEEFQNDAANKDRTYLPVPAKTIVFEAPGLRWDFADPTRKETNADGQLRIKLFRTLPRQDPSNDSSPLDDSPKSFVVTARVGMVRNDTTVTF